MATTQRRVLHLVSGDLWGGAEALVLALASEQHRIAPGQSHCIVMNPGELATRLQLSGVPVTILDESRQSLPRLIREVDQVIRAFEPGILHAHREKENLIAALAGRLHLSRTPRLSRITTVHGLPEPVQGGSGARRAAVEYINSLTMRHGLNAIVCVSRDIAVRLRTDFPDSRVFTIHNGIAMPEAAAHFPSAKQDSPLRLVALGRLVPVKRFDRLYPLSGALAGLGVTPLITLAGDGPLHAALRELLKPGDSDSPFRMPGFVRNAAPLLGQADALVVTSDHEGIPMAVLESLSAGIPVFAFRVGGLPEIEAPGLPLYLVPPGDVDALAREIAHFFTRHDPGTRIPPPPGWSFDIRECAREYERVYANF